MKIETAAAGVLSQDATRIYRRVSIVLGSLVLAIGAVVLTGWALDISFLKSPLPGAATMKANAAFAFVLLGAAILFSQRPEKKLFVVLGKFCAFVIIALGLLTLTEYFFGYNFGIDELFFQDIAPGTFLSVPGRAAFNTALNFVILGLAICALGRKTKRGRRPFRVLAILAAAIAYFSFVAYLYGVSAFAVGLAQYAAMSVHSSITFILAAFGILYLRVDDQSALVLLGPGLGGRVARRLMPLAVILPLAMGIFHRFGENVGFFNHDFGLAIETSAIGVVAMLMIWQISFSVNKSGRQVKESEARFRTIFDNARDGILLADGQTKVFVHANKRMAEMLGYSVEEIKKLSVKDIHPVKDLPAVLKTFEKQARREIDLSVDLPMKRKDGSIFYVDVNAFPITFGGKDYLAGFFRDATERRLTALAEKKFKILYDNSADAIMTVSPPDWKFTAGNPAAIKLFNIKDEKEFTTLGPYDLSPEKQPDGRLSAEKAMAMINEAMKNGSKFFEWTHKKYKGESFPCTVLLAKVKEPNGKEYLQATVRDITREKEDEAKILNLLKDIRSAKARDEAILSGIGDGVFVLDNERRVILFNPMAEKISGFTAKEALGKKYTEVLNFVFEGSEKVNDKFVEEAMNSGKITQMANHTILIRKDGTKVPVADSASPVRDENGKIFGCVVVFRDITIEREVDRAKSEFVSVASHQLRTPLTGIKWFAELMMKVKNKKCKMTAEQKDYLKQIHISNERMIRLVDDLLDVSRIDTGRKFSIVLKDEDIGAVVKESIAGQQIFAEKKKIKMVVASAATKKLKMQLDREKIKQAFNNLISNAIKYSSEKARIEIGREEKTGEVVYFVKDRGMGIPFRQQKKIFDKFFRADNAVAAESGTGLGLYIAKAIVEGHDGKIWFSSDGGSALGGESKEKGGATFYVSLPLSKKSNF